MKSIVVTNEEAHTSLCCKSSVIGLRECSEYENEVQSINVCTGCNSEAPKRHLFFCDDSTVAKHYITQKSHETQQMEQQDNGAGNKNDNATGRAEYHTKRYCEEQRRKSKLREQDRK